MEKFSFPLVSVFVNENGNFFFGLTLHSYYDIVVMNFPSFRENLCVLKQQFIRDLFGIGDFIWLD
jgi:hypothetical protein